MRYVVVIIAFLFSSPLSVAETPSKSSISIGAIASLTGPAAEQGQNWLNGAKLAAKELYQRENIHVTLHAEDDASRAASVPIAFQRLVTSHKVQGIIGGTWSYLAGAASPVSKSLKVPFITPTNPIEVIEAIAGGNPWFFTNGLSIHATEEAMRKVVNHLGATSVASIVVNVDFGILHAEALKRIATAEGLDIFAQSTFEISGSSETLKLFALRVAKSNPGIVLCVADYPGLAAFVKEARRLGYRGTILTTQHLDEAAKLYAQPDAWSDVIGIYPAPASASFKEAYIKEYGSSPKVYAAEGYDALLFLARALSQSVDLSAAPFQTEGVAGPLRSLPGNPEISHSAAVPMVVVGERLVEYRLDS
jgi:branched-chain amino acid transport system substrate-binding protein